MEKKKKFIDFMQPDENYKVRLANSIINGLFMIVIIIAMWWFMTIMIQPKPFTLEGECDTGHIGIDYRSDFYTDSNFTTEYIPKSFNLKDVDNIKCKYKISGSLTPQLLGNILK